MKLSLPPKLVAKLVWVPVISFRKIFIPSYAFDALLCRNGPFSPPDRLTLRITLIYANIYNKWKRILITEYKTVKSWKCEHVWKDKSKCKNTFNKNSYEQWVFSTIQACSGTPREHQNVNTTPLTRFANDDGAKVAQTGGNGLQFCWNWGRNEKSGWKQYTRGKQRTKLIVSPKLVLRRVLPPSFEFPSAAQCLLLIFFIISNLLIIRSCKSSQLVLSFSFCLL